MNSNLRCPRVYLTSPLGHPTGISKSTRPSGPPDVPSLSSSLIPCLYMGQLSFLNCSGPEQHPPLSHSLAQHIPNWSTSSASQPSKSTQSPTTSCCHRSRHPASPGFCNRPPPLRVSPKLPLLPLNLFPGMLLNSVGAGDTPAQRPSMAPHLTQSKSCIPDSVPRDPACSCPLSPSDLLFYYSSPRALRSKYTRLHALVDQASPALASDPCPCCPLREACSFSDTGVAGCLGPSCKATFSRRRSMPPHLKCTPTLAPASNLPLLLYLFCK